MYLFGVIYFIVLALLITALFSYGFSVRGPWGNFWAFFIIVFLAVWAADLWVTPFGPYWYEVNWFPPLIVGVLIAILLAAATPSRRRGQKIEEPKPEEIAKREYEKEAVAVTLGSLFWLILTLFVVTIIIGLLMD